VSTDRARSSACARAEMQVYLYETRVDDTDKAIYIGLYIVESLDKLGYAVGTRLMFDDGKELITLSDLVT
jgi:hypothetical protein